MNKTFKPVAGGEESVEHEQSPPNYVTSRNKIPITEIKKKGGESDDMLARILATLGDLKADNEEKYNSLKSALDHQAMKMNQQYEHLKTSIDSLKTTQDEVKERVAKLEDLTYDHARDIQKNQEQLIRVGEMEDQLEEMNRKLREKSVEIRNIPFEKDESCLDIIKRIYEVLSLGFKAEYISDYRRINTKQKFTIKPMIVDFNTIKTKMELLGALRAFNKQQNNSQLSTSMLGFEKREPVFIAEHLTSHASKMYYYGRDLKKKQNFKHCWTSMGRVFVRRTDDSPTIQLRREIQYLDLRSQ